MTLLSSLFLLVSVLCHAQKQYAGIYAGTHTLQLKMTLNTDKATDSLLKQMDSTSVENLFSYLPENKIETRITFTSNEAASLMNMKVIGKPYFVQMNSEENRYLYIGRKIFRFNSTTNAFEAAEDIPLHSYRFTGKTKTILGYTCHEARISPADQGEETAWVCKELPASISPGVFLAGNPGAVLEFSNASVHNTLIELKPSDATELKAALEKVGK